MQPVDVLEEDLDLEDENCPAKSNVSQNRQFGDSEIVLISKMANQYQTWTVTCFQPTMLMFGRNFTRALLFILFLMLSVCARA
jgi:hypothetical protein